MTVTKNWRRNAVGNAGRGLFPTPPALLLIALVFSVGLDHFLVGAREKTLVAVSREVHRGRAAADLDMAIA